MFITFPREQIRVGPTCSTNIGPDNLVLSFHDLHTGTSGKHVAPLGLSQYPCLRCPFLTHVYSFRLSKWATAACQPSHSELHMSPTWICWLVRSSTFLHFHILELNLENIEVFIAGEIWATEIKQVVIFQPIIKSCQMSYMMKINTQLALVILLRTQSRDQMFGQTISINKCSVFWLKFTADEPWDLFKVWERLLWPHSFLIVRQIV